MKTTLTCEHSPIPESSVVCQTMGLEATCEQDVLRIQLDLPL